ncbi:unnamed protein product [Haemonchus placei]|uniref:Uncharacterized protein n=1 Tax=Haemonchus placei TaxID=6290 RepID=A0A0N4VZ22_HAEPC|nr:unnamed protein product [Haemonchus placei]
MFVESVAAWRTNAVVAIVVVAFVVAAPAVVVVAAAVAFEMPDFAAVVEPCTCLALAAVAWQAVVVVPQLIAASFAIDIVELESNINEPFVVRPFAFVDVVVAIVVVGVAVVVIAVELGPADAKVVVAVVVVVAAAVVRSADGIAADEHVAVVVDVLIAVGVALQNQIGFAVVLSVLEVEQKAAPAEKGSLVFFLKKVQYR